MFSRVGCRHLITLELGAYDIQWGKEFMEQAVRGIVLDAESRDRRRQKVILEIVGKTVPEKALSGQSEGGRRI